MWAFASGRIQDGVISVWRADPDPREDDDDDAEEGGSGGYDDHGDTAGNAEEILGEEDDTEAI